MPVPSPFELLVIDTPPTLTDTIRAVIAVADLVLIPGRPSPHDLRAVGVIVEMAEAAGIPFCFIVNGATPRTSIALEAVRALAQHGKVALVTLHQRIDFAASMVDGRTAGELNPQSRSATEMVSLWQYVVTQLRKSTPRAVHGDTQSDSPGRRLGCPQRRGGTGDGPDPDEHAGGWSPMRPGLCHAKPTRTCSLRPWMPTSTRGLSDVLTLKRTNVNTEYRL